MDVIQDIAPTDAMFDRNGGPSALSHYFACGQSALKCISAAATLIDLSPASILDFGCGAGRVTRWLRAAYPDARLSGCDVRGQDLEFVRERFDAEVWVVDPLSLTAPHPPFDLIWVGSVVTHLDALASIRLLRTLFGWLSPQGLLVASLHGRTARQRSDAQQRYIHAEGWNTIRAMYDATGYGYADYIGQPGYGISVCAPQWSAELGSRISGARIVLFGESLWDRHHDIIALCRA